MNEYKMNPFDTLRNTFGNAGTAGTSETAKNTAEVLTENPEVASNPEVEKAVNKANEVVNAAAETAKTGGRRRHRTRRRRQRQSRRQKSRRQKSRRRR